MARTRGALPPGRRLPADPPDPRRWPGRATSSATAACTSPTTSSTRASASRATPTRSARTARPGWEDRDGMARPHVRDLRLRRRDREPALHDRHLHRPGARPHDGGQDRRHDGRAVGQPAAPRRRRRLEQGGVRPDRTGLRHPRQAPRRDDRRPPRPVARRVGRVPRRLLRRPGVPDGARPHRAGADHRRRPLPGRAAAHRRRCATAGSPPAPTARRRRGSTSPSCARRSRRPAATRRASASTCRSTSGRASTCTAASPTPA